MDDRGDAALTVEHGGQAASGVVLVRDRHRLAGGVGPAVVADPVDDLERGIVEGVGERRPEVLGLRMRPQPGDEPLHRRGDEQVPAGEADQERQRHQGEREREQPEPDLDLDGVRSDSPRGERRAEDAEPERGGERDGRERPPHEARGSAHAECDAHGGRGDQEDDEPLAHRPQDILDEGGLDADDRERVGRARRVARRPLGRHRELVHEQRGRQEQDADDRRDRADDHPVAPRHEPAGRERQHQVGDAEVHEPARDPPGAVEQPVLGRRQRREAGAGAREDEQRTEPLERRPAQRVHPDGERRRDDQHADARLQPDVARARAGDRDVRRERAHHRPGDGHRAGSEPLQGRAHGSLATGDSRL